MRIYEIDKNIIKVFYLFVQSKTDKKHVLLMQGMVRYTVNPLYTDIRYSEKISYNLTGTKASLKRWHLRSHYALFVCVGV